VKQYSTKIPTNLMMTLTLYKFHIRGFCVVGAEHLESCWNPLSDHGSSSALNVSSTIVSTAVDDTSLGWRSTSLAPCCRHQPVCLNSLCWFCQGFWAHWPQDTDIQAARVRSARHHYPLDVHIPDQWASEGQDRQDTGCQSEPECLKDHTSGCWH